MRGNRSELAPGRKLLWCHANTPLHKHVVIYMNCRDVLVLFHIKHFLFIEYIIHHVLIVN